MPQNGYTQPRSKTDTGWNQVKTTSHESRAIGQKQIVPVFEGYHTDMDDSGTPVKRLPCLAFNRFCFVFSLTACLYRIRSVPFSSPLLRPLLSSFVFFQAISPSIHCAIISLYSPIMRAWVRVYVNTFIRVNHAPITFDCCATTLVQDTKQLHAEIKQKHTRSPLELCFHTPCTRLAQCSHPDLSPPKLNLDTSKYIISRRQLYLRVIVPQKRVRRVFGQSIA